MEEALDAASRLLADGGVPEPRREAQRLMGHLLGADRGGVVARRPDALKPALAERFSALVGRRARREPLQYIIGEVEFFGLSFRIDRRAFIPRPDTEQVVDRVLDLSPPHGSLVADFGTGSGCIAVSLAVKRPDLRVLALELSAGALELARENAARHAVHERITFVQADLAAPPPQWGESLDVLVSNPPYVSEDEWVGLAPEVRDFEPREALVPGPSGLEAYRALALSARRVLRSGGWLVVELGYRSEKGAREAFAPHGFEDTEVFPDLRGIPRVFRARRSPGSSGAGEATR